MQGSFFGWFVELVVQVQDMFVLLWLLLSAPYMLSPYIFSLTFSPSPSKLSRQSCRVTCLLICVSGHPFIASICTACTCHTERRKTGREERKVDIVAMLEGEGVKPISTTVALCSTSCSIPILGKVCTRHTEKERLRERKVRTGVKLKALSSYFVPCT